MYIKNNLVMDQMRYNYMYYNDNTISQNIISEVMCYVMK